MKWFGEGEEVKETEDKTHLGIIIAKTLETLVDTNYWPIKYTSRNNN